MNVALSDDEKKFHKLMQQEAKADQELIKLATKELKRAEKAYQKSVKKTEKAEKAVSKAVKERTKASKLMNKAEHKHKDAVVSREHAEKAVEDKSQRQSMESQDVQQRQSQLFEIHRTFDANERDRIRRMSAFRNSMDHGNGVNDSPYAAATQA